MQAQGCERGSVEPITGMWKGEGQQSGSFPLFLLSYLLLQLPLEVLVNPEAQYLLGDSFQCFFTGLFSKSSGQSV